MCSTVAIAEESLPARVVVQHLMLLNRWQLHLWRKANLVDVSMDGKGLLAIETDFGRF